MTIPAAVKIEALRIAKNLVKDMINSDGQILGMYKPSEITLAAKLMLKRNPEIYTLAEDNLRKRKEAVQELREDLKKIFKAETGR